jgi:acetyltransferase-like isoleucine patch superfamily enzyme
MYQTNNKPDMREYLDFLTHLHFFSKSLTVVWMGDNVKVGDRCIIKDNCIIEAGVVLGDDTVIPPFTRISISHPTIYHELPPSMAVQMQQISLDRYAEFKQGQRVQQ